MRILCLGATGPSGILIVRECIAQFPDSQVVVYARSPDKLPSDIANHSNVVVVKGTLEDTEALSDAIQGVDAILSALGPTTNITKAPFYPHNTPLAHGYEAIIQLMHKFGVKRLIVLGTASIVDSQDKFDLQFSILVHGVQTVARGAYKDVVALGKAIREKGADLEWTIARVPLLTNKDSKDVIAGYVGDGKTKTTLSRAGFAYWVVQELQKSEWVRKAPLICSA